MMLRYLSVDIMFQEANSFSRAKLKESWEIWEPDNIQGQIQYLSIFSSKVQVVVFIIVQICFTKSMVLKMFDGLYYYWW